MSENQIWNKNNILRGEYAENLISQEFIKRGWEIEPYDNTEGSHKCDFKATKGNKTILVESKAKPKMNRFPMTGVDVSHFHVYKKLSKDENLPLLILFADHKEGTIMGGYLSDLEKTHTEEGKTFPRNETQTNQEGKKIHIRFWPTSRMKREMILSNEDIAYLRHPYVQTQEQRDKINLLEDLF